jgi:hypothetical protein
LFSEAFTGRHDSFQKVGVPAPWLGSGFQSGQEGDSQFQFFGVCLCIAGLNTQGIQPPFRENRTPHRDTLRMIPLAYLLTENSFTFF